MSECSPPTTHRYEYQNGIRVCRRCGTVFHADITPPPAAPLHVGDVSVALLRAEELAGYQFIEGIEHETAARHLIRALREQAGAVPAAPGLDEEHGRRVGELWIDRESRPERAWVHHEGLWQLLDRVPLPDAAVHPADPEEA